MSESIYNLLPKEQKLEKKEKMYKSKWEGPVQSYPGSTFGCTGSTHLIGAGKLSRKDNSSFGPQKNVKELTSTYYKTKEEASKNTHSHIKYESRLPPVPTKQDEPIYGLKTNKNFVTTNAVEAILAAPKRKPAEPNYLEKEDYGKVPGYLKVVKEEVEMEKELIKQYVQQQLGTNTSMYSSGGYSTGPEDDLEELPESECTGLIRALKFKWGQVNHEYQKLTHMVNLDTIGKKRRKETLEQELKSLEANILKLEKASKVIIH